MRPVLPPRMAATPTCSAARAVSSNRAHTAASSKEPHATTLAEPRPGRPVARTVTCAELVCDSPGNVPAAATASAATPPAPADQDSQYSSEPAAGPAAAPAAPPGAAAEASAAAAEAARCCSSRQSRAADAPASPGISAGPGSARTRPELPLFSSPLPAPPLEGAGPLRHVRHSISASARLAEPATPAGAHRRRML